MQLSAARVFVREGRAVPMGYNGGFVPMELPLQEGNA